MKFDHPSPRHMHQQRRLWQDAFGDPDAFLDCFYGTAYSPDRCLCIFDGDQIAAVLYWIDCALEEQKLAYIYAVVTAPAYRGRGLCRQLMAHTHALLSARGYVCSILVPQKESLRAMYAGMGYENFGGLGELSASAGGAPVSIRAVGPAEFACLRKKMLPHGAVIQEGEGLAFLAQQMQFYAGQDFLLAAYAAQDTLFGVELLGSADAAPGILKALGFSRGTFRTPGREKPFAMVFPLVLDANRPEYFGFAFD